MLLAKHAMLGAMGGLVREIRTGGQCRFVKFVGGAFVAIFCALLMHYACKWQNAPESLTAVLSGLSGYVGTPLLDFCTARLRKLIIRMWDK